MYEPHKLSTLKAFGISFFLIWLTPMLIFMALRTILSVAGINCHSDSGGSIPLPSTSCGQVLFYPIAFYYLWFLAPIPLVIPGIATILLTIFLKKRSARRLQQPTSN